MKENMNKQGIVKRVLGALMVLVLVVGMLPNVPARAANTTYDFTNYSFSLDTSHSTAQLLYLNVAPDNTNDLTKYANEFKAADSNSGIWLGTTGDVASDTKLDIMFRKDNTTKYILGSGAGYINATVGQILTIKGTLTANSIDIVLPQLQFQYTSSGWVEVEARITPIDLTEYAFRLDTASSNLNGNGLIYLIHDDATANDIVLSTNYYADSADDESGVWLNGTKITVPFVKDSDTTYRFGRGSELIKPSASGDTLKIQGVFTTTDGTSAVKFGTLEFEYTGTAWKEVEEEVGITPIDLTEYGFRLDTASSNLNGNGLIYLIHDDATANDIVLSTNYYADSADDESGVWLNGAKITVPFVKDNNTTYRFGRGSELIKPSAAGDTLKIQGVFTTTDGTSAVKFGTLEFEYTGTAWKEVEEEVGITPIDLTEYGFRLDTASSNLNGNGLIYLIHDDATANDIVLSTNYYADSADDESGVWLNGTKITVPFVKDNNTTYRFGRGSELIKPNAAGDILKIQGVFTTTDGTSAVKFGTLEFKYNGSSWEVYVPTTVIDMSEETITISSLNEMNNTTPEKLLYLAATDYSTLGTDVYYAKDENSGIYINGVEVTTRLKRGGTGYYQVGSGAEPLDAIAGDVLTIKGTFVGQKSGTEWIMPSLQFKFTGTTWVNNIIDMRNDVVTVYESSVNSANLFNFQSTNYSELETGVLYSAKASDTESGVFLGETAVTTQIKRAATGVYQVGNGDAPINASAGAVVTVKGEFFNPDKTIALILPEMKFQYVSDLGWILYTEKAGDYTGDGATDVRDLVRIKRYLNNNNVQLAKAAQIDSDTIIDDNDVNDLYYILLCGYEKDENGILLGTPYYVDDVAVERMAYECPEVGTYDSSTDTFTAYSTTEVDEAFQKYKLAGLTLLSSRTVAPLSDDSTKTGATARLDAYMEAAERNGLRVLVDSVYINTLRYDYNDDSLSEDEFSTKYGVNNTSSTLFAHDYQQKVYNQVSKIVKYGNTCAGFIVGDEWKASEAELYNNIIAAIRKAETDFGLDLIVTTSQYPSSAYDVDVTLLQEGATSSNDEETLYRDYINKFGTNGMFTFDIYPLIYSEKLFSGSAYSVNEDFFNSLKWMAEEARDNDIAHTGITIQSCGLDGTDSLWSKYERYTPENKEDIGFQIYTSLAYGVKEINYFTYNDHPVDENVHDSINENVSVYTAVQTINNELDAFDHVYMNYTWKNALDIAAGTTISATQNDRLSKVEVTGGRTIIGCMEDRLGYDGYMIANAEGPRTDNHAQVTLTFANADQVIVYANGKKTTQTLDANGTLTLAVNVGEGAFVIPIKSALTLLDFVVEVEEGKDPVVLQITDTQIIDAAQQRVTGRLSSDEAAYWANDQMEERCYDYLTELITSQTEEPDLILVTGDLVYGEFDDNGTAFEKFVTVMDSFQIPWAPIFGNHEAETKVTDGTLSGIDVYCKLLEASAESDTGYCLFKQRALTGNGNYTVGIQQGTELKRVFFMLDSNGCYHASDESLANKHTKTSVGFGEDQIEWYTDAATQITAVSPATKLSFAFHIQLAAFTDAYAKYGFTNSNTVNNPIDIDNAENKADGDFGYLGRDLKDPWDSRYQVYEGLKSLGVDSIFVGHEHCNSASVVYEGIRFQFGQKSSTYDRANYLTAEGEIVGAYKDEGMPLVGGTFIPLDADSGVIKNPYIYLCEEE